MLLYKSFLSDKIPGLSKPLMQNIGEKEKWKSDLYGVWEKDGFIWLDKERSVLIKVYGLDQNVGIMFTRVIINACS